MAQMLGRRWGMEEKTRGVRSGGVLVSEQQATTVGLVDVSDGAREVGLGFAGGPVGVMMSE